MAEDNVIDEGAVETEPVEPTVITPSHFIKTDETGVVLSTLITSNPSGLPENHGMIEVDDVAKYEGKRYVDGVILPIETIPEYYYLHVTISGGDGGDPIGVANDGVETATVDIAFRASEDPASDLIPVDESYRFNIRDDQGAIADVIKIQFIGGQCSINYNTTGQPGIYHIDQIDFTEKIGDKSIKLVGDSEIKIYRDFTA